MQIGLRNPSPLLGLLAPLSPTLASKLRVAIGHIEQVCACVLGRDGDVALGRMGSPVCAWAAISYTPSQSRAYKNCIQYRCWVSLIRFYFSCVKSDQMDDTRLCSLTQNCIKMKSWLGIGDTMLKYRVTHSGTRMHSHTSWCEHNTQACQVILHQHAR